jgi:hypothetical protein
MTRRFMIAATVAILTVPTLPIAAQEVRIMLPITGLPDDWSHHHLIFSNPGTAEDARNAGRYDQWLKITTNPRYLIQQLKRGIPAQGPFGAEVARLQAMRAQDPVSGDPPGKKKKKLRRDWSEDMGGNGSVGVGRYPAKYTFDPIGTPSCTGDFVVFNTGLAGSSSQASIIAYNNLYSSCTGAVPQIYWQYNTGGTVLLSPILSPDGSQVAFMQGSLLTILKWKSSSTLTTLTSNSSYRSCSAPCMVALNLSFTDTNSSPFYDYTPGNDALYVGDDAGQLHKFTGVFNGTPTAAATISVRSSSPLQLTGPVYDPGSGKVFVGDFNGELNSVAGSTVTTSGQEDFSGPCTDICTGPQDFLDSPIVDSSAATAYIFIGQDTSGNVAVGQFPTNFASGAFAPKSKLAAQDFHNPILWAGSFDNQYFTSSNSSSPTGNMYLCASGSASSFPITLFQVPIASNVIGSTAKAGPTLASATSQQNGCSPVTEIFNSSAAGGPFDWIYLSVPSQGSPSVCSGGCIMKFIVTQWQASHVYTAGQEILDTNLNIQMVATGGTSGSSTPAWTTVVGHNTTDGTVTWTLQGAMSAVGNTATAFTAGTSGIVVDNTSTVTGASQVYFSTLGNQTCATSGGTGGCAVQSSQSAP